MSSPGPDQVDEVRAGGYTPDSHVSWSARPLEARDQGQLRDWCILASDPKAVSVAEAELDLPPGFEQDTLLGQLSAHPSFRVTMCPAVSPGRGSPTAWQKGLVPLNCMKAYGN